MAIPGFKADAMESAVGSDGEVVRSALSSSLDIRVAEALADYCDKIVTVMQLCGKRFSERADANGLDIGSRRQMATLYKHILHARREASEFYVFSGAHTSAELKAQVDTRRAAAVIDLARMGTEVETAFSSLVQQIPSVDTESTAFLNKIRGDFYAFRARVEVGDARNDPIEKACAAYAQALSGPNERTVTRLGTLFSRAVLDADICGDREAALTLIRATPPRSQADLGEEHEADCVTIEKLLSEAEKRWLTPVEAPAAPTDTAKGQSETQERTTLNQDVKTSPGPDR
eukprot:m.44961 g.44961  ORF g.44961 m.44961 type:complete len:288 (-) comp6596_c0_seq2:187-1050(-)